MLRRYGRWLAVLPPLAFLPFILSPPLNHDVAGVFSFAQRWLAGERLYIDIIDVNPPLIFILNLAPAWFAHATGLDPVRALQGFILAFGLLAGWLALRVRGPVEGCTGAYIAALPALFLLGPGYDFGQREALMAVAALPYLLASARRMAGERVRHPIAIGLLAGIGFALKPHFLAIPALVEVFVARHQRDARDPLRWAMLAVGGAYAIAVLLVFPAYLAEIVPMALETYVDLGGGFVGLLAQPRLVTILVLLHLAAVRGWRAGREAQVFVLAAAGAAVSALIQHKGWSYHLIPIELFTFALIGLLVAHRLDDRARLLPAAHAAILTGAVCVYLVGVGETPWNQLRYRTSVDLPLRAALDRIAADSPTGDARALVLSRTLAPIYPALLYANVTATAPMLDVWPLGGAYRACEPGRERYHAPAEMGRAERFYHRQVTTGMRRAPPDAVLIDRYPRIPDCPQPFDLLEYFRRNPDFAIAFAGYRQAGSVGQFDIYLRAR